MSEPVFGLRRTRLPVLVYFHDMYIYAHKTNANSENVFGFHRTRLPVLVDVRDMFISVHKKCNFEYIYIYIHIYFVCFPL